MRFTLVLTLASAGTLTIARARPTEAQGDARVIGPRTAVERWTQDDHRAALGITTGATGTLRDTLGLMITSIVHSGPADRAGLEEGNRLAAINGVSLRASATDLDDQEISHAFTHRLTRELGKVKPGEEVELRVYRDGRTQSIRVKTADADTLFHRRELRTIGARSEWENRPALGLSVGGGGNPRDTLGVLVVLVADSTPAYRAGIEEGNRIAAINGANLRVPREDAGDRYVSGAKARRLQREISQLKPGDDATLRVYAGGQFRDVRLKVARAADLPRRGSGGFYFGDGMDAPMPPMPPIAPMHPMPPAPMRWRTIPMDAYHLELDGSAIEAGLREVGLQLQHFQPMVDQLFEELPIQLERIRIPDIRVDIDATEGGARVVRTGQRGRPATVRRTAM